MTGSQSFGESFKVYNNHQRVVAQFQFTDTQKDSYPSITIELAPLAGTDANWQAKSSVQLTRYELTLFTRVLFGLAPLAEGAYHGTNRNKGFRLQHNGPDGASLTVSEGGQVQQIMFNPQERLEVGSFVIRRLAMGWQMAVADVLALLRQSAMLERQPRPNNQQP